MWVHRMLKDLSPRGAAGHGGGRMGCQGCAAASGFARDAVCPLGLPDAAHGAPADAPDAAAGDAAEPAQLHIRVLRREGYLLVRLAGEVDLATVCTLHFALDTLVRESPRLAVDAAELTFIDVLGVRMLRRAREQAVRGNGWLRLIGVRPQLGSLLELLGLTRVLPAHRDEDALNLSVLPRA